MKFLNEMVNIWIKKHFDSQPVAANLFKGLILAVAIVFLKIIKDLVYHCILLSKVQYLHLLGAGDHGSLSDRNYFLIQVVVPGQWPWWQRPMPAFAKEKANWSFTKNTSKCLFLYCIHTRIASLYVFSIIMTLFVANIFQRLFILITTKFVKFRKISHILMTLNDI